MKLNKEQIKKIIPHRDPFLLIDQVIDLQPGVHVTAIKQLSEEDEWFKGHFPSNPVQPGVLTIEMLAQAGAVCVLSLPQHKGKIVLFGGINNARFKHQAKPGDLLYLDVKMTKLRSKMGIGQAVAKVKDQTIAKAELMFAFGETKNEDKINV